MSATKSEAFSPLDEVRGEFTPYAYFQNEADRDALVAAYGAGLHILAAGEPGGGKTTIAKGLAQTGEMSFGRLQGDPMNTTRHVLGTRIWDQATGKYEFIEGPIFNNVLLLDEANRNTGPTQAAFIQGMQEKEVTTMDQVTRPLPRFFRVIATQNFADDTEGINLMTDANVDRFGFFIDLSKPYDENDALKVKIAKDKWEETGGPSAVVDEETMIAAEEAIRQIERSADPDRVRHAQFLVRAVREHGAVDEKASILDMGRPFLQMLQLASGLCALEGTVTLQEDHINRAAPYILPHRTKLTFSELRNGTTPQDVIAEVVKLYS